MELTTNNILTITTPMISSGKEESNVAKTAHNIKHTKNIRPFNLITGLSDFNDLRENIIPVTRIVMTIKINNAITNPK